MSIYMFIAADYPLPLVDYSNTKYYKFKQGVKVKIDGNGKLVHYTNDNDINSPDLLISCSAEEADIIAFDSEEDLYEIKISLGHRSQEIEGYTKKKHVFTLDWRYTDKRAEQLIGYLKNNVNNGTEIELWIIWIDEWKKPIKYYCNIEDLKINDIKEVFDGFRFEHPTGIVISKK